MGTRMVKRGIILIGVILLLAGCSSTGTNVGDLVIDIDPMDQVAIAGTAGYTAAFMILRTQRDLIPEVKQACREGIKALDDKRIDIADIAAQVIEYTYRYVGDENYLLYAPIVAEALRHIKLEVEMDIVNDVRLEAILKAFMEGAIRGARSAGAIKL